MARATKIKDIHILRRNGRWTAVWQSRRARVVRHADTPEHVLISLLASEMLEPNKKAVVLAHLKFAAWLESNSLMDLRRRLLFAKGRGWDDITMSAAVRAYREWRREQTSGTSLGLGE
nr:hypothetical protein K21LAMBDA1_LOCUS62 [Klebsiella phage vB_Kpn_K21lambda1]